MPLLASYLLENNHPHCFPNHYICDTTVLVNTTIAPYDKRVATKPITVPVLPWAIFGMIFRTNSEQDSAHQWCCEDDDDVKHVVRDGDAPPRDSMEHHQVVEIGMMIVVQQNSQLFHCDPIRHYLLHLMKEHNLQRVGEYFGDL